MQPLDTADDRGIRQMLQTFEPWYDPPSRKTIATKYLPQIYEAEHAKIKKNVSKASSFALTTDLWTSWANHAYTGVTIHYVNDNFELKHYLLETK